MNPIFDSFLIRFLILTNLILVKASFNCSFNQFKCLNGVCLDISKRCDQKIDCFDFSDEANCDECPSNQFRCSIGLCTVDELTCEQFKDCNLGVNHTDCAIVCKPNEFRCSSSQCIKKQDRCNNKHDCQNGLDERFCEYRWINCRTHQFRCKSGKCIDKKKICDGWIDCLTREDEYNCVSNAKKPVLERIIKCKPNERRCGLYGHCIPVYKFCDNIKNCPNGEDEINCVLKNSIISFQWPVCQPNQFQCNSGRCISKKKVCNNWNDCPNREDERNCWPKQVNRWFCQSHEYKCKSGECVLKSAWCDGKVDCKDGDDELFCKKKRITYKVYQPMNRKAIIILEKLHKKKIRKHNRKFNSNKEHIQNNCAINQWSCIKSKYCIEISKRCNGIFDCNDCSDEANCDFF